jgi:hypothetical protein
VGRALIGGAGGSGSLAMLAAMGRASSQVRREPPRVGQRTRASNCPAHDEKMLTCKHNNLLARGKTMRPREFIALLGASVAWPFAAMGRGGPIALGRVRRCTQRAALCRDGR